MHSTSCWLYADRSRSGYRWYLPGDVPDEGGEFARDRGAGLVVMDAPGLQAPEAAAEPELGATGDVAHGLGLALIGVPLISVSFFPVRFPVFSGGSARVS